MWLCPRLTITGEAGPADGSELIEVLRQWQGKESVRFLAVDDQNGGALTIKDYVNDVRSVFQEFSTVDPMLFSTYGCRRAMPTAAEISQASGLRRLAIGDWQELKGQNALPLRYAAEKQQSAGYAKLRQMALIQLAFKANPETPLFLV